MFMENFNLNCVRLTDISISKDSVYTHSIHFINYVDNDYHFSLHKYIETSLQTIIYFH